MQVELTLGLIVIVMLLMTRMPPIWWLGQFRLNPGQRPGEAGAVGSSDRAPV